MVLSPAARHRARYLVPLGAAAITAVVVIAPQAASGAQHPNLPPRSAAQLLASLEQAQLPQFSGTTVETSRLGLPDLNGGQLAAGFTAGAQSQLTQILTLLTGSHTAQIAYGGPDRQRVAIFLSDLSETDIVHNGNDLWTYASDSNSVTHTTLDHPGATLGHSDAASPVDPTKAAERALAAINPSTKVTVDRTARVAGRSAYQLDLAPRDSRTLVASIRIALDSRTSMPLRVEIWSRKNTSAPAFSVGFTSISMSAPSASTFDFTKPPSATLAPAPFATHHGAPRPGDVRRLVGPKPLLHRARTAHPSGARVIGKDWTSVLVDKLSTPTRVATASPQVHIAPGGGDLTGLLDRFGTRVAAGHLITTSLVTILLTNDNTVLIGAVTPQYIEQVAAGLSAR
jgi:outer membrane lipoprotein-sorting protein